MQELRSTDILDKEIEADARRKAEAILKRADEECESIMASVQKRIENARLEKDEFYSKKLAALDRDLTASGPLEKQRFKVSFIQQELMKAINSYLAKLSQDERLKLVTERFDFSICSDRKLNAYVYGFDCSATEALLKQKLNAKLVSCTKTEFGKIVTEDEIGLDNYEGIILEAQDKSIRCRLTLVQIIGEIIDKYRQELSQELFGGTL